MIFNEGIRSEEIKNCYLCDEVGLPLHEEMRDRLFDAPGVWNIFHCPKCGLMWLNPRPIQEDNHKVYTEYFTHAVEDVKPIPLSTLKKLRYYVLAHSYGYDQLFDGPITEWVGKTAGILPFRKDNAGRKVMWVDGANRGTLLDIGCGHGKFLALMRQFGWKVMGVEPDAEAADVAREKFGIDVVTGTLEEAAFPEDHFEAVTMGHVIEHVYDPIGLLKECHRVLKPNGNLVVTTPNVESLGHRNFQKSWLPLDPPRHLHLFPMGNLRACAERAGLKIKSVRTEAHSSRWIYAESRIIQMRSDLPEAALPISNRSLRLKGKGFQLYEYLLGTFRKNAGEEIVMIATKKSLSDS